MTVHPASGLMKIAMNPEEFTAKDWQLSVRLLTDNTITF